MEYYSSLCHQISVGAVTAVTVNKFICAKNYIHVALFLV